MLNYFKGGDIISDKTKIEKLISYLEFDADKTIKIIDDFKKNIKSAGSELKNIKGPWNKNVPKVQEEQNTSKSQENKDHSKKNDKVSTVQHLIKSISYQKDAVNPMSMGAGKFLESSINLAMKSDKNKVDYFKGLKQSIGDLKKAIETVKISIGKVAISVLPTVLPILTKIVNMITQLVNKFNSLPKPIKNFIVVALMIASAITPALTAIGSLLNIFKLVKIICPIVSGKLLLIIAAIGAIAFVIYEIIKHMDILKKVAKKLYSYIKKKLSDICTFFKKKWEEIKGFFKKKFDNARTFFKEKLDDIIGFFKKRWEDITGFFGNIGKFMSNIGHSIMSGLCEGLYKKVEDVRGFFRGLGNSIKSIFKKILGINSPSRVFKCYGQFIGDGLIEGLEDQQNLIDTKVANMGNGINNIGYNNLKLNPYNVSKIALDGVSREYYKSNNIYNTNRNINFKPNIVMNINVEDTGKKGTEQLTKKVRSMAETSLKNTFVNMFMNDAIRD